MSTLNLTKFGWILGGNYNQQNNKPELQCNSRPR